MIRLIRQYERGGGIRNRFKATFHYYNFPQSKLFFLGVVRMSLSAARRGSVFPAAMFATEKTTAVMDSTRKNAVSFVGKFILTSTGTIPKFHM